MNLEQLISEYSPPTSAVDTVRRSKIALLVGITGAGKGTIKQALLQEPEFGEVISHTTRQPRENNGVIEQDGVDYHFITPEQAKVTLGRGDFIEAKFVHGTVYGTTVEAVREASKYGIAVNDIDVQGVAEYRALSEDVVAIFIVPPSYQVWMDRLRKRHSSEEDFLEQWPKRRQSAIKELTEALESSYYQFVVNDDIDQAVNRSLSIVKSSSEWQGDNEAASIVIKEILGELEANLEADSGN